MSAYESLLVDRTGTGDRIARVPLNRPRRANALSDEPIVDLNDCLRELEADHEVRVGVRKDAGRGFGGAYDLAETPSDHPRAHRFKEVDEQGRNLMANMRAWYQKGSDLLLYFWNMQKVTIAQLHGFALAGGCELAMMADLVVASDECRIGHPGLRGPGTARNGCLWPLVMGMRKAKELCYTGDSVTVSEAADFGMINSA